MSARRILALIFAVTSLVSGCAPNPKHLDERLATQLLTKALADRQVTVEIEAKEPSRDDSVEPVAGAGQNPMTMNYDQGAENALLAKGYVVKRFRRDSSCKSDACIAVFGVPRTYVITAAGRSAQSHWQALADGDYSINLGTGYAVSNVRDIRFFTMQGAYYAVVDYDATPMLNAEGRDLARTGDVGRVQGHRGVLLLMSDGWVISADGS